MAHLSERPYGNANFLVDFGHGQANSVVGGFSEVVFPRFESDQPSGGEPGRLVLKRGFIGSLDLYAWWHKARSGRAPKRKTLLIKLLADDHERVVATWRFSNVRPVCLAYSPLSAIEGSVLIEVVEFSFDRMEMR